MKKLLLVILACLMVLVMAGCSKKSSEGGGSASGSIFTKPITVVVPFKAGSATDNQLRLMKVDLEKALGTTLVIINAEGGSGTIGTTEFLNSYKPDGYTILYSLATPIFYKPLGGDTAYTYEDLTSVARTSSQPMYLIVSNQEKRSGKEIIDFIKANPGQFTYSNVGNGGNGHIAFASFLMGEGLDAVSVPYSGGTADCYTAMMGGEVNAAVYGEADLLAREENHAAINLGSKSTIPSLANVPTLADLGYKGYETNNLAGFFYKKGVPAEMTTAFEKAVQTVLTNQDFVKRVTASGFVPSFGTGAQMDAQAKQAIEKATPVIKSLK